MWSWASDLLGSTRALSISSAVNFKSTPMTGSKTCKKETSSFLHEIFIKKKNRERDRGQFVYFTLKKLRTVASSHRPRIFSISDFK
jgi:predicted ferric reductase